MARADPRQVTTMPELTGRPRTGQRVPAPRYGPHKSIKHSSTRIAGPKTASSRPADSRLIGQDLVADLQSN